MIDETPFMSVSFLTGCSFQVPRTRQQRGKRLELIIMGEGVQQQVVWVAVLAPFARLFDQSIHLQGCQHSRESITYQRNVSEGYDGMSFR